jgi:CHAT domain-containing protein
LQAQGDYAAARPANEKSLALSLEVLGERHPDTISTMSNLAALLHKVGDDAMARELAHRAARLSESLLASSLPALSEREQLALISRSRLQLNGILELTANVAEEDASVYGHVLAAKGLVAEASAARRLTSSSEARAILLEIQPLRTRLVRLYNTRVTADDGVKLAQQVRETIDEINLKELQLARTIAWKPEVPEPDKLSSTLPENAILIDLVRYPLTSSQRAGMPSLHPVFVYAAFVIRRGQPVRRVELGPADPVEVALNDFRTRIETNVDHDVPGRELAKLVWTPLAAHFADNSTVLLSPDGPLNFLPWAAMPDPGSPERYLLERYTLATVGSGRQLLTLARRPTPNSPSKLLSVGGVDYDHGDIQDRTAPTASPSVDLATRDLRAPVGEARYGALPATGPEANAIAEVFRLTRGGSVEVLSGTRATNDLLRTALVGQRYLHLATHGYFAPPSVKSAVGYDPNQLTSETAGLLDRSEVEGFFPGLLSGLVWAGANTPRTDPATKLQDRSAGTMTAEEVSTLDLSNCDLAVLSACETGRGITAGGEGVLGLQRAFHQAGCRSVVASLWRVDDEATGALMVQFYEHLWKKGLSPLAALRQAQIDMLEGRLRAGKAGRGIGAPQQADPKKSRVGKRVHPRYWAAWSISGPPPEIGARAPR